MDGVFWDAIKGFFDEAGIPPIVWITCVVFSWGYFQLKKRVGELGNHKRDRVARLAGELTTYELKNKYVVEQLFLDRYGCTIDYPIIEKLLDSASPSANFSAYAYSKPFFDDGVSYIRLKDKYTRKNLKRWEIFYLCLYAFFAVLFCISLYFVNINIPWFSLALLLAISSMILAFVYMERSIGAGDAIKLIDNLAKDKYYLNRTR